MVVKKKTSTRMSSSKLKKATGGKSAQLKRQVKKKSVSRVAASKLKSTSGGFVMPKGEKERLKKLRDKSTIKKKATPSLKMITGGRYISSPSRKSKKDSSKRVLASRLKNTSGGKLIPRKPKGKIEKKQEKKLYASKMRSAAGGWIVFPKAAAKSRQLKSFTDKKYINRRYKN